MLTPEHRLVTIGGAQLVATLLPAVSHLVRLHPVAGEQYDRMTVVSEINEGRELFLSGWIGRPLGLREWRAAKDALFPAAQAVAWERRRSDGSRHLASLPV
jgi:hypothetical protein